MQTFVLSPRFETGISDMDDQHRRLVDLINGLGSRFRVCLPLMPASDSMVLVPAVDPVVLMPASDSMVRVPAVGSVVLVEKEEGA